MINRLLGRLTPKRIIIYLAIIAVAIYVVWYVNDALKGLNPNYKPFMATAGDATEIKGGTIIFDPTQKTPEALPAK